jgi:hypothetical protein
MASKWGKSPLPSNIRPWLVTWLSLGVLIFAIAHLAALGVTAGLDQVQLSVPPFYLYGKTLVWAAAGLVCAIGLFTGRRWAPAWTKWLALIYIAWYWVDRLLFSASDEALGSWKLSALLMGMIVGFIWWSLSRSKIQRFFRSTIDE